MMYHLRLLTYIWEAKQDDVRVKRSYLDGMQKKWTTDHSEQIEGQAVDVEDRVVVMLRFTEKSVGKHVKSILKKIQDEKPLHTIDFTFSEWDEKKNREIYSGVL